MGMRRQRRSAREFPREFLIGAPTRYASGPFVREVQSHSHPRQAEPSLAVRVDA